MRRRRFEEFYGAREEQVAQDIANVIMHGGRPRFVMRDRFDRLVYLSKLAFVTLSVGVAAGVSLIPLSTVVATLTGAGLVSELAYDIGVAVAGILIEAGYRMPLEEWFAILEVIVERSDDDEPESQIDQLDPSDHPEPSSGDLALPDQISDIDSSLGRDIREITNTQKRRTPRDIVLDRLRRKFPRGLGTDILAIESAMREHSTFNANHCCVDLGHIPFDTKKKAGYSTALTGQPSTVYRNFKAKYRSQSSSSTTNTGTLWFFFEPGAVGNSGADQALSYNTWTSASAGMNNVYELDSIFSTLSRTQVTYNKWNITDSKDANSSVQLKNQYMKLEVHNPSNDTPCHVDLIVLRCKKAVNAKYGSSAAAGGFTTEGLNNYMNDAWNKFTGATWATDSNLRPYQDIFSDNLFLTSHFEVVGGRKFALNYQQSAFMTFSIVKNQIMSFKYKLDSTFQPRDDASNLGLTGYSNVICRVGEIQFLFNIHGSIPNTADVDYNAENLEAVGAQPAPAEVVMYAHKRYTYEPLELAKEDETIAGTIVVQDYAATF